MDDDVTFVELEDAPLAHGKLILGERAQPLAATSGFRRWIS